MVRKRITSRSYTISRWLLNALLFICLLLSSELSQQPQHFQSYHTELALTARETSTTTVTYPRSSYNTDGKEIDKSCSISSFIHSQLHYSSCLSTKLKNGPLVVRPILVAIHYLQFQSTLPGSDEDLFLSSRG